MRGEWVGSEGRMVHLPRVVADNFGCSINEAGKLLRDGQIRIDDEVTYLLDIPVDAVAGHRLSVGRESVDVPTEDGAA